MTRVLVTRPQPDNARLCDALLAAGYEPVALPLAVIESLPPDAAARRAIEDLDQFDVAICTSTHAARYGYAAVDRIWPQLPLAPIWLAVGAHTRATLDAHGIAAISPQPATSEGLLDLPVLADVADKRCLIMKGQGGRDLLARVLRERGARVEHLELYRRQPLALDPLPASMEAGFAVVTSAELLAAFEPVAPPLRQPRLRLIVPSERVARLARRMGYGVCVAAGASVEATLTRLREAGGP